MLTDFYKKELQKINKSENQHIEFQTKEEVLYNFNWSATKVDLIELIYALQCSGTINNGNSDIKKIAKACEQLFNIDLGNYYRTFSDIRSRKMSQTKFIDKLKDSLLNKIIDSDH
jgi:hypothetical protein